MSCSSLLLPPLPDVPPFVAGNPTRHLYSCDNSTSGLSHIPGFPKPRTFPASHHAPPASTLLSQTLTQGRHVPAGGCWSKGALGPGVPSVPGARSPRNCCTGRPCPASPKVFLGCFGLVSLLTSRHLSFGVTSGRLCPWIQGHIFPSGSPLCESLLLGSGSGASPPPKKPSA